MTHTISRASAHPKSDPFRAIECAREARFDHLHDIKPVVIPAVQPQRRQGWLSRLFSGV